MRHEKLIRNRRGLRTSLVGPPSISEVFYLLMQGLLFRIRNFSLFSQKNIFQYIFCLHVTTNSVFHVHAMEKGIIVFHQQIIFHQLAYRWVTSQSFWVLSFYLYMLAYICPCGLGIIPLTLRFRSLFVCIYLCSLHVCMFVYVDCGG